jgi:hypothetical protein
LQRGRVFIYIIRELNFGTAFLRPTLLLSAGQIFFVF